MSLMTSNALCWWNPAYRAMTAHLFNSFVIRSVITWAQPAWNWTNKRGLFLTKSITRTGAHRIKRLMPALGLQSNGIGLRTRSEMKKVDSTTMALDIIRRGLGAGPAATNAE